MKKIYTIKKNTVFTRMYTKGKSTVLPSVVLYTNKNTRLANIHIGITAGKKLGGAVLRNRARRIIREAFRELLCEYESLSSQPYYIVFVARSKCFRKTTKMQYVKKDIKKGLKTLGLIEDASEEQERDL